MPVDPLRSPVTFAATLILAGPAVAQQAVPPSIDDIVVLARRGAPPPLLDPVGYFARHCFDAARHQRAFAPPADDHAWSELDAATRKRFAIIDPAVPAYSLVDEAEGQTLVIKFERLTMPGRLIEHRCTLAVVGGDGHDAFERQISRLFGSGGTQRHVGGPDGVARLPGWRQRVWTGNPLRGSPKWQAYRSDRGSRDSYLVVTDRELFYATRDFILAEVKTRVGPGRPLSTLMLAWTTRIG